MPETVASQPLPRVEKEYWKADTYDSTSESSTRRLLATLLCNPSDSSLWKRASSPCGMMSGMSGSGGTSAPVSPGETSSCIDLRRLLRPTLNSLDILRREDVSLFASSEPRRLLRLSKVPSPDVRRSPSPDLSLPVTDVAVELTPPLDGRRATGATSEFSLLPSEDVVLCVRSKASIVVVVSRGSRVGAVEVRRVLEVAATGCNHAASSSSSVGGGEGGKAGGLRFAVMLLPVLLSMRGDDLASEV